MTPPLVSFITWNRLGLTARNLNALLDSCDDFELHICDNNSADDTWEYLQQLKDNRIKSITRFDVNRGPIYAINFNLAKRKKDQYFITVDSDVNIHTNGWITKYMEVFEAFSEVGLLGAVSNEYYANYRQILLQRKKDGVSYLQLLKGFVEGCCQCISPSLLNLIGYWNEENGMGDMEICFRICNFTPYKVGFLPSIEIDQLQKLPCEQCTTKDKCTLSQNDNNCFKLRDDKYRNPQFRNLYRWKYEQCIKEMTLGKRQVFSASVHDEESQKKYYFNRNMAEENFRFYILNAN